MMDNFMSIWLGHEVPNYSVKHYARYVCEVFLAEINIWKIPSLYLTVLELWHVYFPAF